MTKQEMMAAMEEADTISKTLQKMSNMFYGINDGGVTNRNKEVMRLKDIGLRMTSDAARVSEAIINAYRDAMNQ